MEELTIKEIELTLKEGAECPKRGSDGAAGYDLYSNEYAKISPGQRKLVGTGVFLAIPVGFYGLIKSRSGIAFKKWVDVEAGVIDSDYRGEIKVLLHNNSKLLWRIPPNEMFLNENSFEVNPGDKIAQIIFQKHETPELKVVTNLSETNRGDGGFGSTGK